MCRPSSALGLEQPGDAMVTTAPEPRKVSGVMDVVVEPMAMANTPSGSFTRTH
jgi:hypothetical protein